MNDLFGRALFAVAACAIVIVALAVLAGAVKLLMWTVGL